MLLAGCATTSRPPAPTMVHTPQRSYPVEHRFADTGDGRRLHYVEVGEKRSPAVVFVHGTPGSWRAFEGYLARPELLERFHLVSVDRLGFGGSEPGKAETSVAKQAASLAPLLESLAPAGKPILVGHSYGGPVIAKVAMDHPEAIGGLVMVAPSIDPDLERLRWYNHLASWRLLNWAIPREWLVSNREILPLKKELAAMLDGWSRIAAKTIVIQGEADTLVPPQNADFAARMLPAEKLAVERIPAAGHFVLWQQPELIVRAILSFGA
jgi:pimeloyl-ACP methyl ester carboxylesterase